MTIVSPRCSQQQTQDRLCTSSQDGIAFPWRLHDLLDAAATEGFEHIVCWNAKGNAFKIHNPDAFEAEIMPRHLSTMSKRKSFIRQLNLYCFSRSSKGPDRGAYSHPLFLRDRKHLCNGMALTKFKGGKPRKTKRTVAAAAAGPSARNKRKRCNSSTGTKSATTTKQSNRSVASANLDKVRRTTTTIEQDPLSKRKKKMDAASSSSRTFSVTDGQYARKQTRKRSHLENGGNGNAAFPVASASLLDAAAAAATSRQVSTASLVADSTNDGDNNGGSSDAANSCRCHNTDPSTRNRDVDFFSEQSLSAVTSIAPPVRVCSDDSDDDSDELQTARLSSHSLESILQDCEDVLGVDDGFSNDVVGDVILADEWNDDLWMEQQPLQHQQPASVDAPLCDPLFFHSSSATSSTEAAFLNVADNDSDCPRLDVDCTFFEGKPFFLVDSVLEGSNTAAPVSAHTAHLDVDGSAVTDDESTGVYLDTVVGTNDRVMADMVQV